MYCDNRDETDTLFTVLANRRRRWVVRYLQDNRDTTLSTIAADLAQCEGNDSLGVYANLYQNHILKLDASDIVEYNDQSKDVTVGPKHQRALEILTTVDQAD